VLISAQKNGWLAADARIFVRLALDLQKVAGALFALAV
jgi:hypothetical protein